MRASNGELFTSETFPEGFSRPRLSGQRAVPRWEPSCAVGPPRRSDPPTGASHEGMKRRLADVVGRSAVTAANCSVVVNRGRGSARLLPFLSISVSFGSRFYSLCATPRFWSEPKKKIKAKRKNTEDAGNRMIIPLSSHGIRITIK